MTLTFREDIERLRGLAVLSVVLFHFETPGINGGFVGVDFFFVISGYLITQIIQTEMRDGTFSFARFYERRLRRLLPPLYVMILIVSLPAFHYLLTSERISFFQSIASAVTFTSNIFFWSQSGYFDRTAVEKPLLHTWSLSVEEQFYLVFPVLIWAILRFGGHGRRSNFLMFAAMLAAIVLSFSLGIWLLQWSEASAFYMSPARAWEFLVGAIIAVDALPVLRGRRAQWLAQAIAYIALLVPIFGLRQLYTGFNVLAPCLGAGLFIWSGSAMPAVTHRSWLSPLNLFRFLGRISYSLYLWHWPLFTFARFSKTDLTLTPIEKVLLFAITIAISYLSWKYVERPFRRRLFFPTQRSAFVAAVVSSISLVLISGDGMLIKMPDDALDRKLSRLDAFNNFDPEEAYRTGICFIEDLKRYIDTATCLTSVSGKTNVLLWGNSHGAHYYPGLAKFVENQPINLMQATAAGCMPTLRIAPNANALCKPFYETLAPWFDANKPDIVFMSSDWMDHGRSSRFDSMIEEIRSTIATLTARGTRVILLGPSVQFKAVLPSLLIRAILRHVNLQQAARDMVRPDIFSFDARMRAALPSSDRFTYVSVVDAVCPNRECPVMVANDVPLVWDYGHLTIEGSNFVIEKLASTMGLTEAAESAPSAIKK
jgi:peptidoglycan/LPS O-acetylase OafA/YrhL